MVSAVRSSLNALNTDVFLSDRYILTILQIVNNKILERHIGRSSVAYSPNLYQTIPCVELERVPISSCGIDLSGCDVARSVKPIPKIFENRFGLFVNYVGSIDGKKSYDRKDTLEDYRNTLILFPHRQKTETYWMIENNHLIITNPDLKKARVSALFTDLTTDFEDFGDCEKEDCPVNPLDRDFPTLQKLELDVIEYSVSMILNSKYRIKQDETSNNKED